MLADRRTGCLDPSLKFSAIEVSAFALRRRARPARSGAAPTTCPAPKRQSAVSRWRTKDTNSSTAGSGICEEIPVTTEYESRDSATIQPTQYSPSANAVDSIFRIAAAACLPARRTSIPIIPSTRTIAAT